MPFNTIFVSSFVKFTGTFKGVTLKHGHANGLFHWCTYWCVFKRIQTRTNSCKIIKSQYSQLKSEKIAKMYQKLRILKYEG